MQNKKLQNNSGFALFVAVTLVSVLLIVVFAVSNFAYKQLQLSSLGKDSILSFYAAESGMECARYSDSLPSGGAFSTTTAQSLSDGRLHTQNDPYSLGSELGYGLVSCGGSNTVGKAPTLMSIDVDNADFALHSTTTIHVYYGSSIDDPCAKIIVSKMPFPLADGIHNKTVIVSRGYNICDPESKRRRTERAIQYTYW